MQRLVRCLPRAGSIRAAIGSTLFRGPGSSSPVQYDRNGLARSACSSAAVSASTRSTPFSATLRAFFALYPTELQARLYRERSAQDRRRVQLTLLVRSCASTIRCDWVTCADYSLIPNFGLNVLSASRCQFSLGVRFGILIERLKRTQIWDQGYRGRSVARRSGSRRSERVGRLTGLKTKVRWRRFEKRRW